MKYLEEETIGACFIPGLIDITASTIIKAPIKRIELERDADLDLIFTIIASGVQQPDRADEVAAGTVRQSEDTIHFQLAGGGTGIAKGVNRHNTSSSIKAGRGSETIITYSAHSVEVDFKRTIAAAYVIEWVDNLPTGLIWVEHTSRERITKFSHTLGSGDAKITMSGSSKNGGGGSALHLKVGGYDFYIIPEYKNLVKKSKKGRIIYKGIPAKDIRDKIRSCVSFVLGVPIVYYGVTEYCADWQPTAMHSVSAFSIGGAMFRLYDQPPYPISSSLYLSMIDPQAANEAVNALYAKYDALKFNELSWSYWYAMCAPIHTSAVHFGGLIEKLQKSASVDTTASKLLEKRVWKTIQDAVKVAISDMQLGTVERAIVNNKISNLNQAPQNLILSRTFESMGLVISELECEAWKHRNSAAHGGMKDNPVELILSSKVLRLVFHRLLAGITYCSDRYIDYYSFHFPVRLLSDAVPSRE